MLDLLVLFNIASQLHAQKNMYKWKEAKTVIFCFNGSEQNFVMQKNIPALSGNVAHCRTGGWEMSDIWTQKYESRPERNPDVTV